MRKTTWNTLVALALAAAGISSGLRAGEPEGVVVLPGNAAGVQQEKSFNIRQTAPIHLKADASAQDPGVRNAGPVRYSSPLEAWIVDRNAVTYPPDYGWSRPVKRPVDNRVPVQYHRMDPDYWYGDPRAFQGIQQFPMVYMPTDTTQLGFYYQRVPTWQANPNMIPGPPWPSTWHNRECPDYQRLHHPDIRSLREHGGYGYGDSGHSHRSHRCRGCGVSGLFRHGDCCENCAPSYGSPTYAAPQSTPGSEAPAPSAAPQSKDKPAAPADLPAPEATKSTRMIFPGSIAPTATNNTGRPRS